MCIWTFSDRTNSVLVFLALVAHVLDGQPMTHCISVYHLGTLEQTTLKWL
jgi:hypothetical protein